MFRFAYLILVLSVHASYSQKTYNSFLAARYGEGILVAHRPNMYHLVQKNNRSVELSWLIQRTKKDLWGRVYHQPLVGFNLSYRSFGYKDVLGSGYGLTYMTRFTLLQTKKNLCLELQSHTGFGIVTKRYDKFENPKNIAIGSYLNAKTDLELFLTKFHKKFHYGIGIGFSHFSNGAFKAPNLGLNTLSLFATAGYNLQERTVAEKFKLSDQLKLEDPFPDHNLNTELILTAKQANATAIDPKLYPVVAVRVNYIYRPRIKWGADVSLDLIYNGANPFLWPEDGHTSSEAFQVGIYTGAVTYFYNTAVYFGGGVYLVDPVAAAERIYDRLGIQHYFSEKWYALFTIKANYAKADYFEFGVGYRVKAWGKN